MTQLRDKEGLSLRALHFNHGLQSESSEWAKFCERLCDQLNVPFSVNSLSAGSIEIKSRQGLEASARTARYDWFKQQIEESENSIVLTAHHANDQAETVLFNLIRGSGVSGLRGMRRLSTLDGLNIVRPLLSVTREQLEQYAIAAKLKWIDDPSNLDERYTRNKLRHGVLATLIETKQDAVDKIVSASQRLAEAEKLLVELAEQDLKTIEQKAYCPLDKSYAISLKDVSSLLTETSEARVKNALKHWLNSANVFNVNSRVLSDLLQWVSAVNTSKISSKSLIEFGQYCIRYYRGFAYVMPKDGNDNTLDVSITSMQRSWRVTEPIKLKELGVKIEYVGNESLNDVDILIGGGDHQGSTLKKKFQTAGIPSWRRPLSPVLKLKTNELICLDFDVRRSGFKMTFLEIVL